MMMMGETEVNVATDTNEPNYNLEFGCFNLLVCVCVCARFKKSASEKNGRGEVCVQGHILMICDSKYI